MLGLAAMLPFVRECAGAVSAHDWRIAMHDHHAVSFDSFKAAVRSPSSLQDALLASILKATARKFAGLKPDELLVVAWRRASRTDVPEDTGRR